MGLVALVTIGRALGFEQGVYEFALLGFIASWPGFFLLLTVVPGAVYAIEQTSIIGPRQRQVSHDAQD